MNQRTDIATDPPTGFQTDIWSGSPTWLGELTGRVVENCAQTLSAVIVHAQLLGRDLQPNTRTHHQLGNIVSLSQQVIDVCQSLGRINATRGKSHEPHCLQRPGGCGGPRHERHCWQRPGAGGLSPDATALRGPRSADVGHLVREMMGLLRMFLPRAIEIHVETDPREMWVAGDGRAVRDALMRVMLTALDRLRSNTGEIHVLVQQQRTMSGTAGRGPELAKGAAVPARGGTAGRSPELVDCRQTPQYGAVPATDTGFYVLIRLDFVNCRFEPEAFDPLIEGVPARTTADDPFDLAGVPVIIREQKGGLDLRRESQSDTTITFSFPALRTASETQATISSLLEPSPMRGRVFVIDDERIVVDVLAQMVESIGFEVEVAVDPRHGLHQLLHRHSEFECAIVDWSLGVVDGHQLITRVREEGIDLPIILMSGFPQEVLPRGCWHHPQIRYLGKPFRRDDLLRTMVELLGG